MSCGLTTRVEPDAPIRGFYPASVGTARRAASLVRWQIDLYRAYVGARERCRMEIVEGGCLCTAVGSRISGAPLGMSICHCKSCRRADGAPSVAWAVFAATDFAFVTGQPVTFRSSPPVVRSFCGTCGTPLTYQHEESLGTIDVTTASLDFPERFAPTREIWLDDKLAWEPVNEALPHYRRTSREETGSAA